MTQIRKWSWLLHIFLILVLGLPYCGWLRNPPLPWFFNPSHSWDVYHQLVDFATKIPGFFMVFPWFFTVFHGFSSSNGSISQLRLGPLRSHPAARCRWCGEVAPAVPAASWQWLPHGWRAHGMAFLGAS